MYHPVKYMTFVVDIVIKPNAFLSTCKIYDFRCRHCHKTKL